MRFLSILVAVALVIAGGASATGEKRGPRAPEGGLPPSERIQLLVRADDLGVAQGINEAAIEAYEKGIVRSVEVIAPGPWFLDAVRRLEKTPGLDVGVHLTLTSEWERIKWRPLTSVPSLVDADGYFFPMTSQRKDFPPNTGFLDAGPRLEEVERELRAQIELVRRHLPRVSHLSAHMGAARATPELRELTARLAREYGLVVEEENLQSLRGFPGKTLEEREGALVRTVEGLTAGRWLLVEHPALDTPETRALGHKGYEDVAGDRAQVLKVFTSSSIREALSRKGVELVSYAALR